jgi:GTP-binding protein
MTNVNWAGRAFTLIDTGGVDFDISNAFAKHIREQVDIAIDLADVIVFVVDGESGIVSADSDVANMLRKSKKPIVLCVNKLENKNRENEMFEFYDLHLGDPIAVSCTQRRGLGDLLDGVIAHFPPDSATENLDESTQPVRIAIIGKPNAGKSSITNRLLGTNRTMVSDIAGTTRDSIDTPFRYDNADFILTDTAGVRRKRSIEVQTVEHYSVLRAMAAIRNSHVSVLVIDATEGITEQDVRLAAFVHNEGKPSVICINKWDAANDPDTPEKSRLFLKWTDDLAEALAFMPYFKAIFTSALTGQRISEIMRAVNEVIENTRRRVTTGKLNQMIANYVSINPPPRTKVKYATQVATNPPTFAIFVSKKQFLPPTYERYLENCLRKENNFTGTPIRILIRENTPKGDLDE